MPFMPRGLESQKHPLKHRFSYAFGLSHITATQNSAWVTLVRSSQDPAMVNPNTIFTNPHNTAVDLETGPLCQQMSIIERIKIIMTFNKHASVNVNNDIKVQFTPFFCAFPEKYDAADDDTGTTVASIMQLTKDATNKDIVPLSTNDLPVDGVSELPQPVSTVNDVEVFGDYNMTTDLIMEDTPFDNEAFQKLIIYGTNKGALKSCLGKTRRFSLSRFGGSTVKSFFFKKFVPRNIRRIVPYTFFGLLIHVPIDSDIDSYYSGASGTGSKPDVGVRVNVRYDEWNEEHLNTMVNP